MTYPRLTIDLKKLADNARLLRSWYQSRGVAVVAVSKAVLGDPQLVSRWLAVGIETIADSRLSNIQRMRNAGLQARWVLTRTQLSQVDTVVALADVSHNSDLTVLAALGQAARSQGVVHEVILMVETGDLREGVMLDDFPMFLARALEIQGIKLAGIGTNMGCVSGSAPSSRQMQALSELTVAMERRFRLSLGTVSGGSSSCHDWLMSATDRGRINQLRIGELLLLGREPMTQRQVEHLHGDVFTLQAEVIEVRDKPYFAERAQANGPTAPSLVHSQNRRAVLALGSQDVVVDALRPRCNQSVLGSSGDHLIVDPAQTHLRVGELVDMDLDYAALLSLMTSPFVHKQYLG
ncbi:MAG: alanine racemase [Lysobacteraceae bacterium]|nr:MAG: alanine racemase [Xanthomonadaceae bacterium]